MPTDFLVYVWGGSWVGICSRRDDGRSVGVAEYTGTAAAAIVGTWATATVASHTPTLWPPTAPIALADVPIDDEIIVDTDARRC